MLLQNINQIKQLIQKKNFTKAKELIMILLERYNENINLLLLLIQCLDMNLEKKLYCSTLKKILELEPYNYEANIKMFKYYLKNSQYDFALLFLLKLKSFNTFESNYLIAKFYYEIELYDEAIIYAKNALSQDETNLSLLVLLIEVYTHSCNIDLAFEYCKKAKLINPNSSYVLLANSKLFKKIGNYKKAIRQLKLILKFEPNLIPVHLELLKLYIITENSQMIIQTVNKLVTIDMQKTCYDKIKFEISKIKNNKILKKDIYSLLEKYYPTKVQIISHKLSKSNRRKSILKKETKNSILTLLNDTHSHHMLNENYNTIMNKSLNTHCNSLNINSDLPFMHILQHNIEKNKKKHTCFNGDAFFFLEYFLRNIEQASKKRISNNKTQYKLFYKNCGHYSINSENSNIKNLNHLILIINTETKEILTFYPAK